MSFNRQKLAILSLAACGIAAVVFRLAWMGEEDSRIQFLARHPGAEWIVYPSPLVPSSRRILELDGRFQRSFNLKEMPSRAILTWRAFKRGVIKLNGWDAAGSTNQATNWKHAMQIDVTRFLHPGENLIEVTIYNDTGPPALWLTIATPSQILRSDDAWQASLAGAEWRQARLANSVVSILPGSPFYGGQRITSSLASHWPQLLLAGIISTALYAVARVCFRRMTPAKGGTGPGVFTDLATACLVIISLAWIGLFVHNANLLPGRMGFDAPYHLDYIKYIQERGTLPLANEGPAMYNPPLFYLAAAGVLGSCSLTSDDFAGIVLLRYFLLAAGIAHLVLVFLSLRLIFPRQTGKQVVGLVLAGFLPAQLYLAHYITNEFVLTVLVTATIYYCLRALEAEKLSTITLAGLGGLMGAALLTKVTALLVVPCVIGALALRLFQTSTRDPRIWAKMLLVPGLTCLLVCGWQYGRVWARFGRPLVGFWDAISGHPWWQDPGYRTSGYFARFGQSLREPLFSGHASLADGVYSTLWGDGYCGGSFGQETRPPWNYELMNVGYVLALLPATLMVLGAIISAARLIRKPAAQGLLLNGLAWSFAAAFFYMALKVPWYSQVKAFYGLLLILPACIFGAEGWDSLTRGRRIAPVALSIGLGAWALISFSSYWISNRSGLPDLLIGQELALKGQHEKAAQRFSAALELDPNHLQAKSWLADSLAALGQRETSKRLLKELRAQHPQSAVAQLDLALDAEKEGRLTDAVEHTRQAIQSAPEEVFGYRQLASRLMRLDQPGEVIKTCREGLRISPAEPELHTLLGKALMEGRHSPAFPQASAPVQEAIHHLRLALQLSPNSIEALDKLAWILASYPDARWRNGVEAVDLAEQACTLIEYRQPELVGTLAAAYAEAGRFSDAIMTVHRAQTLAQKLDQQPLVRKYEDWLKLFAAGQPYRDPP